MTYQEARNYLNKVSKTGSILGLDAIRSLLDELGNPQQELSFVHIAGTNGKGSVLAFLSSACQQSGLRIGTYSSPAVFDDRETIQVDGEWIPEERFASYVEMIKEAAKRMEDAGKDIPTVFEMETAAALLYFRDRQCDLVILECGLGGSRDATNIISNTRVAVFTPISMDHSDVLGDTITEIAREKAGIIKPGCQVVSAPQSPEVSAILKEEAAKEGCPIRFVDEKAIRVVESRYQQQKFFYLDRFDLTIHLAGMVQVTNAATAWECVQALKGIYPISDQAAKEGLEKAEWPGRLTCLNESPLCFIDGAHNVEAAKRLSQAARLYFPDRKIIGIVGIFRDKDADGILQYMGPLLTKAYTVSLPNPNRTMDPHVLKDDLLSYCETEAAGSISEAVREAWQEASDGDVILAFGSLSHLEQVRETVEELKQRQEE